MKNITISEQQYNELINISKKYDQLTKKITEVNKKIFDKLDCMDYDITDIEPIEIIYDYWGEPQDAIISHLAAEDIISHRSYEIKELIKNEFSDCK